MGKIRDLTGQKFERLFIIGFAGLTGMVGSGNRKALWHCHCDCGTKRIVMGSDLLTNKTKSCGCLNGEIRKKKGRNVGSLHAFVHGHSQPQTPTYRAWYHMKRRCQNPQERHYDDYGGRGISVCDRWLKFPNFLSDMGKKPLGLTLERINNDGNYEPNNCKWATYVEQANNSRPRRWARRPR